MGEMAGVYIKGMEMPDCGYVCLKVFANGEVLMTKERRGALVITGIKDKVGTAVPAADVVEVRHGRWNEVEHGESGVLCECSACKEWMLFYYGFDANYCPNCGADMREV